MTNCGADNSITLRYRRRIVVRLVAIVALALVAASCNSAAVEVSGERIGTDSPTAVASQANPPTASSPTPVPAATATSTEVPQPSPTPLPTPTVHPIAAADTDLPPAAVGFDSLFDQAPTGPQPVSIEIENINVSDATVIPVGVNEDLTFEVPPADQVGWYEFGPRPGEQGSAVLAAHIAFNGVDGVFRYLENVEVGSVVRIEFDDNSVQRYRIEEVVEYFKDELPDELFAREGEPQLALITCGGDFNYSTESYESNTVAIAVPI